MNKCFKSVEYYKEILDAYNICLKDEIIKLIESSPSDDYEIFVLTNILNQVNKNEKIVFKEKCDLFVFLITKSYLDSEFFEKHLHEANELNKYILILLLEDGIAADDIKFQNYKVFNIKEDIEQMSFSSCFTRHLNDVKTKLKIQPERVSIIKKIHVHKVFHFFLNNEKYFIFLAQKN